MADFSFTSKGDWEKTMRDLKRLSRLDVRRIFDEAGREGARILASATPVDSGETRALWSYEIIEEDGGMELVWTNTNDAGGTPVAILLQYGHGTGTGGYVPGRDFINPAAKPVMDRLVAQIMKEVQQ